MKLKINVKFLFIYIYIYIQKFHELKIKMKHEIQNDWTLNILISSSFHIQDI
jgi:hypothetical protein